MTRARTQLSGVGLVENQFAGVATVSTRDLQDKEVAVSEVRLEGRRIQVEP